MTTYETIEAAILSGQVTDADVVAMMEDDPEFAAWLTARASARQGPVGNADAHARWRAS